MDNDAENVKESEKYSFLLGSALRNEDPEQFLSIYDAILPSNLPDNQIEHIKDKAREIADLAEEDFNRLVLKARDFSLAQDRTKMSRSSSTRISDEEDEDIQLGPYGMQGMTYQSFSRVCHTSRDHCIVDIDQLEKRTDNDSGICNSSKATTSVGSYTDQDDDSDGDDRGAFDYFPSKPTPPSVRSSSSINVTPTYHVDYDEAHDVESDKGSQNDIESPRSDISISKDSDQELLRGTEMTTFSRSNANNEDADFVTSDESDTEVHFNCHQKMYGTNRNYYTPMTLENNEEYESVGNYSKFSFENSQKALRDGSASYSRKKVDEGIAFPIYSRHRSHQFSSTYGSTSSDRVRIHKTTYSPTRESSDLVAGKDPPFGSGHDQLHKVGNSIGSLITGTKQTIDGMPEGRRIPQSLDTASDDVKRKKKKRRSRDDLHVDDKSRVKSEFSSGCDENGNPVEPSARTYDLTGYKQMREQSGITGKSIHSSSQSHEHNAYSSRLQHISSSSTSGQQQRDSDESTSQTNPESKKTRKKVKKDKGVERKSEDIENYVGTRGIEELLSFIENDGAGRKSKKLNHSNSSELPTTAKTTEKVNKKNKDKKLKPTLDKVEAKGKTDKETEKGTKEVNNSVKDAKESVTKKSENKVERAELYVSIMGNSNDKSAIEENTAVVDSKNDVIIDNGMKANSQELGNIYITESLQKSEKETKLVQEGKQNKETRDNKKKPTDEHPGKKSLKNMDVNHKMEGEVKTSSVNKTESTVNSVKQNNIKNSKKKVVPADGNDKVVGNDKIANVKNGLVTPMTNGPRNSASAIKMDDTNDLINERFYLFTDIGPIEPVEEEFQVVAGKKKKKGGISVREVPVRELPQPTKIPVKVESHKPLQRSVTPPPTPSHSLTADTQKERIRDLSPSSFPALGSSRSGRDGRRSSTGDVPKDLNIKPLDDSDMESVKSLPASGQAISPRLPVSYAKMAASPKPGGSVSTCSGTVSDDNSDYVTKADLKSAVWKGSPTERRHSIGSSPEGKETEMPPSLRQKFGSQEFIKSGDQERVPPLDVGQPVMAEYSYVDGEKDVTPVNSQNTIQHDSRDIPECATKSSASADLDSKSDFVDSKVDNSKFSSNEKSSAGESAKEGLSADSVSNKNKVHKNQSCENQRNVKSPIPYKQGNRIPKSSVIFLDKQVEIPQDLGITFGFESFLDVEQNESCISVADSVSNSATNVLTNPNLASPHKGHQCNESDSVRNNSKHRSTIPVIHSVSRNQHSPESSSIVLDTKQIHPRNETLKTVNPLEGKNGIVRSIHSHVTTPEEQSSAFDDISFGSEISFQADISEPAKISSDNDLTKGNNLEEKTLPKGSNYILVHFGDSKECSELLVSSNSDTVTRPAGQLNFLVENGVRTDGFNAMDIAEYLKTEWDKVINLQERNPKKVITYSGQ